MAIREFLIEPNRAISPSPGVDAAAVLREAVAARTRRQIRDGVLLALLVVFALANLGLFLIWLVLSALWKLSGVVRTPSDQSPLLRAWAGVLVPGSKHYARNAVIGVLVILLAVILLPRLLDIVGLGIVGSALPLPDTSIGAVEILLGLSMLAVLLADEFVLSTLLVKSFRRSVFTTNPVWDGWPMERTVRTMGAGRYQDELNRIARTDLTGNVIVHRGYNPFVGSGVPHRAWSFVIPIKPAEDDEDDDQGTNGKPGVDVSAAAAAGSQQPEKVSFTLSELYNHVAVELGKLRASPSLSPSHRLSGLTEVDQVIVPVELLLTHLSDPDTSAVLPDLNQPPRQRLLDDKVRQLTERPLEWMRYYRCFRVETWDRNLAVSAYLHFGADEEHLYLEWTSCVLLPILQVYRVVDNLPASSWRPVRHALSAWYSLPVSVLNRAQRLFKRIKPLKQERGVIVPAKYGAAVSLRELAAADEEDNYFQLVDIERYLKLLEERALQAVGQFLSDRNISVTEFMNDIKEITNNYNINVSGSHNVFAAGPRSSARKVSGSPNS